MTFGNKSPQETIFAGQRRRRSKLNRRLLPALGILAVVGLLLFGQLDDSDVVAWLNLRADQAELTDDVQELEGKNAALEERLEALARDPQALEKLARERHNMRRPDEEVLTVIDQPAPEEKKDK